MSNLVKKWEKKAKNTFVGRKIVDARYMTDREVENQGWTQKSVVLILDNGSLIFPSMDDEGNDGGSLFGQTKEGKSIDMPVIRV